MLENHNSSSKICRRNLVNGENLDYRGGTSNSEVQGILALRPGETSHPLGLVFGDDPLTLVGGNLTVVLTHLVTAYTRASEWDSEVRDRVTAQPTGNRSCCSHRLTHAACLAGASRVFI